MRIISGKFKGKKLFLPNDKKTRPLKDLVKESIFNLIQHSNKININLIDSDILDLFSGSGSFGLECLSRGAQKVIFFENYSEALKILKKNIKLLKINQKYEIVNNSCFNYFNSDSELSNKFDIIFIDPPFKEIKINELIEKIIEKKLLKKNGIIIMHRHKKDTIKITSKFKIFEYRKYGISKIFFGS
mgnify:CR=1 FL=1